MEEAKERVPLFRSWRQWYLFVILFLAALILFLTYFTNYFE
jgi:hypothetical protein